MELEHTSLPLVEYSVSLEPRNTDATGAVPLEEGELLVREMRLEESLDGLYELRLTLLADVGIVEVDPEALLEAELTLRITRGDYERRVHGVVARVDLMGFEEDTAWIGLTVVPAVALLARWKRSRIFQDTSVIDIVCDIVREDLAAYNREVDTSLLARTHEVRDYCVQYRETDLEFVQRILAEEGVFILFDHADDACERIVLIDDPASFAPIGFELLEHGEQPGEPPYVPVIADRAETADTEGVVGFAAVRNVATRSVELRGWNWKSASLDRPGATESVESDLPGWLGEHYEHGDRRLIEEDRGDGGHRDETPARATRRLARLASPGLGVRGGGLVTSFTAGHTFTLDGHPNQALDDRAYLIQQVSHRADCPQVERGGVSAGGGSNYANTFECVPLDLAQFPRELSKPRAYGYQTAIVVGPAGQEIHTDRLGRIKVLMHWDRERRDDAPDTSCWLRVAQMWGGAGWGTFFLPRVGMEVLVSFIDGDPDRPVVTGCLYNEANMPPYPLPDESTKSTIKTSTSPGGDGFNELRFEDGKGAEEVFIHAQRDMNTRVRRNQSTTVGNDQRVTVHNDRTVEVEGHERHTVEKDRIRKVDGAEQVTIAGGQNVYIGDGHPVGEAEPAPVPGAFTRVDGTYTLHARDKLVLQVGDSTMLVLTTDGIALSASSSIGASVMDTGLTLAPTAATVKAAEVALQAASSSLALDVTAKLESEVQVRNQVGASKVVCDPVTVRAQGTNAFFEGSMMMTVSSPVNTMISGANVHVEGSAAVQTSSQGSISLSAGGTTETIGGGFIDLD